MVLSIRQDLSGERFAATRRHLEALEEIIARYEGPDRLRAADAVALTVDLHIDQEDRKDGSPYVEHTLEVALTAVQVLEITEPDALIASLLHDSVEDQAPKLAAMRGGASGYVRQEAFEELGRRFGSRVKTLVAHLTNPDWSGLPDRASRNAIYRAHFNETAAGDPVAFAIKLADFSTNALRLEEVRDPGLRERLKAKYEPVMRDAVELLARVPPSGDPLSRLREVMLEPMREALARYRGQA